MNSLYPASPASVPPDLARPTPLYRKRVASAVIGLTLFFLVYGALTGWLLWIAWTGFSGQFFGGIGYFVAIPALCLGGVLVAGLFAVKKATLDGLHEITDADEPELLAFVRQIADEADAPHPAHVYLADNVNAAVFYDAGLKNLFLPTKKNLVIGLGLVNVLSLDELKAVIAHEFGHFGQSAMGVGRWVYISQQFVSELVFRRNAFDNFLRGLSRFDLRIAWVGWILRLIVWSIRAVIEQAFRFVVALSRALGQQMELQADLVAVALTGSDSLVNALYRLSAADEAYGRAADITANQAMRGKLVPDLYALQTRLIELHREFHADPYYGCVPPPAEGSSADHRVFSRSIAETPRMWATHPPNHEREEGCKARYVPSELDPRSAWSLFRAPEARRRALTRDFAQMVAEQGGRPEGELEAIATEAVVADIEKEWRRSHRQPRYQGLYQYGGLARCVARADAMALTPEHANREAMLSRLEAAYPEAIRDETKRLGELAEEVRSLKALDAGFAEAPGGVILHRGESLQRRELPSVIERVEVEWREARAELNERVRHARTVHLGVARMAGEGWEAYLKSLSELLHYAEHSMSEIDDAGGFFQHELAHALADGNVSGREMRLLKKAGADVAEALARVYEQRPLVRLPQPVAERMKIGGWNEALPEKLGLFPPDQDALAGNWIPACEDWVNAVAGAFEVLANHTLDVLVEAETRLYECLRDDVATGPAPAPASIPGEYTRIPFGRERERRKRLSLWDRFQLAEGFGPALLRFGVASAILLPALMVTLAPRWSIANAPVGDAHVVVHNGLERDVVVRLGGEESTVWAGGNRRMSVPPGAVHVETTTTEGLPIESFDATVESAFDTPVYNVAGASPLYRWFAVYGSARERPPVHLGAKRWSVPPADLLFREPPDQVSGRGSGSMRRVVQAADVDVGTAMNLVDDAADAQAMALAHARWDAADSPKLGMWFFVLDDSELRERLASERAAARPGDVRLQRLAMDLASPESLEGRCADWVAASEAHPDDGGAAYVAARCAQRLGEDGVDFAELHARFPEQPWLANAMAYQYAQEDRFEDALIQAERATPSLGSLAEMNLPVLHARLLRRTLPDGAELEGRLRALRDRSSEAERFLALEERDPAAEGHAYAEAMWNLADGRIGAAWQVQGLGSEPTRCVRALVAASDGAPPRFVQEVLEDEAPLPTPECVWARIGLELRRGSPSATSLAGLPRASADELERLGELNTETLRADPLSLDRLMEGADATERAYARMAGVVALGSDAPSAWRLQVRRFLFVNERPYLSAGPS